MHLMPRLCEAGASCSWLALLLLHRFGEAAVHVVLDAPEQQHLD